jgi:hypothetical protein
VKETYVVRAAEGQAVAGAVVGTVVRTAAGVVALVGTVVAATMVEMTVVEGWTRGYWSSTLGN